jgi:hypothetical protein
MSAIPLNPTRKDLRSFGLTTGAIVAVLFGMLFPWLLERRTPWWPWILAAILVLWALAAPATLRLVYRGWMAFGLVMSRITTPIILGVLFFGAVLPTGALRRLLGYDSMARKFDKRLDSYRVASRQISKQSLKRPF